MASEEPLKQLLVLLLSWCNAVCLLLYLLRTCLVRFDTYFTASHQVHGGHCGMKHLLVSLARYEVFVVAVLSTSTIRIYAYTVHGSANHLLHMQVHGCIHYYLARNYIGLQ